MFTIVNPPLSPYLGSIKMLPFCHPAKQKLSALPHSHLRQLLIQRQVHQTYRPAKDKQLCTAIIIVII
jgi:hypothetical protein